MSENEKLPIDTELVRRLVATQFPQWKDLPIQLVASSGWDNKTFHLGNDMLVRMPSAEVYADQVKKEQYWLPKLAPFLPLPIPAPLAIGKPGEDYPLQWSIYHWIEGETAASGHIADLCTFAADLGQFLIAFQSVDSTGGPLPGLHSFYRGGALNTYDSEVKEACAVLKEKIDTKAMTKVWEEALNSRWHEKPVWVHGDISAGNLLVRDGRLSGVIDFGQLTVGDPACDLAIAWTLWKALVTAAGFTDPNNSESRQCWRIIDAILADNKI
jgi:aminoglycoside phosphotransferase (APT) family kinase protein